MEIVREVRVNLIEKNKEGGSNIGESVTVRRKEAKENEKVVESGRKEKE